MKNDLIISREVLAYAAGIIDADGNIGWHSNGTKAHCKVRFVIKVKMTDLKVICFLHDNFGGTIYEEKDISKLGKLPQYVWRIHSKKALDVYKRLEEFLIIKKDLV